jgi:hypothetical protein
VVLVVFLVPVVFVLLVPVVLVLRCLWMPRCLPSWIVLVEHGTHTGKLDAIRQLHPIAVMRDSDARLPRLPGRPCRSLPPRPAGIREPGMRVISPRHDARRLWWVLHYRDSFLGSAAPTMIPRT